MDGSLTFEIWDLAGQANLRPSWAAYYAASNAIIVVADCSDRCEAGQCAGGRGAPLLCLPASLALQAGATAREEAARCLGRWEACWLLCAAEAARSCLPRVLSCRARLGILKQELYKQVWPPHPPLAGPQGRLPGAAPSAPRSPDRPPTHQLFGGRAGEMREARAPLYCCLQGCRTLRTLQHASSRPSTMPRARPCSCNTSTWPGPAC